MQANRAIVLVSYRHLLRAYPGAAHKKAREELASSIRANKDLSGRWAGERIDHLLGVLRESSRNENCDRPWDAAFRASTATMEYDHFSTCGNWDPYLDPFGGPASGSQKPRKKRPYS